MRSRLREGSAAMTRAEAFRAKAAECDKLADQAKDVEAKRMFGEAANHWRTMAEQAQRHGW
jgi:hypothetical protein